MLFENFFISVNKSPRISLGSWLFFYQYNILGVPCKLHRSEWSLLNAIQKAFGVGQSAFQPAGIFQTDMRWHIFPTIHRPNIAEWMLAHFLQLLFLSWTEIQYFKGLEDLIILPKFGRALLRIKPAMIREQRI